MFKRLGNVCFLFIISFLRAFGLTHPRAGVQGVWEEKAGQLANPSKAPRLCVCSLEAVGPGARRGPQPHHCLFTCLPMLRFAGLKWG